MVLSRCRGLSRVCMEPQVDYKSMLSKSYSPFRVGAYTHGHGNVLVHAVYEVQACSN